MRFWRRNSKFGDELREEHKQEEQERQTQISSVPSPTKPTFEYRAPVSWQGSGFGFVQADHTGAHDDPRLGRRCTFAGDCVEVVQFDTATSALKPVAIHVAWPYLTRLNVDELSHPIDLRAPVIELDSFRAEKVWGDMKNALMPVPKSES